MDDRSKSNSLLRFPRSSTILSGWSSAPLKQPFHPCRQSLYTSGGIKGHATGDELPRVVADERTPALRRHAVAWTPVPMRGHILPDSTWRDPQAKFELQLVGHTPLTPRQIVASHPLNERFQLHRDSWSSRFGAPAPQHAEPLTAPTHKRFRLHDHESWVPVEPLRQPDQRHTNGISSAT
jgi:hypothetical protein